MDRSTLIVAAALMALLLAEFAWLELRARRRNRKVDGQEHAGVSASRDPQGRVAGREKRD